MRAIQKVVAEVETKILVYSELGNDDIMNQYSNELKELNLLYLEAMVEQDNLDAKCQAFEAFLDNQTKVA
jgi:hypothetical protein